MKVLKNTVKKLCVLLLTFVIVAGYCMPSITSYADSTSTPEEFFDFDPNTKTITGYSQSPDAPKNVVIPSEINGISVEKIGSRAFAGCQITSVIIPSSVRTIGSSAFSGSSNLANVSFGAGSQLESAATDAFSGTKVENLKLPNSVNEENKGTESTSETESNQSEPPIAMNEAPANTPEEFFDFNAESRTIVGYSQRSDAPKDVVIPSEFNGVPVEKIGDRAFAGYQLTSVVIPPSVKEIGKEGFRNNPLLSSVKLNEGLEIIGEQGFRNIGINSIYIPSTVKEMGKETFSFSEKLKTVAFGNNSNLKSIPDECFDSTSLESIDIPNSVESIGNSAFSSTKLRTITIPDSVNNIDASAFSANELLKEIHIPSKLKGQIDGEPWGDNNTIVYWKDVIKIGQFVFDIPDRKIIRYLGTEANANVNIPNEFEIDGKKYPVEGIGMDTFSDSNISSINIPESIKSIDEYAFAGMKKDVDITFSPNSKITKLGESAFKDAKIKSISLPKELTIIGSNCFSDSTLKSIVIPDSVKKIEFNAFEGSSLENISFGENSKLDSIGRGAFCETKLKKIIIPDSVKQIEEYAFDRTSLLREIHIPTKLRGEISGEPWNNLVGVVFWKDILMIDSYIYDQTNKRIIRYIGTTPNAKIDIPSELVKDGRKYPVECISASAFIDANISSISVPSTIKKIDPYTFSEIHKPVDIIFSSDSKLKEIPNNAFENSNIKSIILPNSIEKIDKNAFKNTNLESITIPDSVTHINDNAFLMSKLKSINFGENSKLSFIGYGAFQNTKIKSISIPKSVESLGANSFANSSLENISFKKNSELKSIYRSAFTKTNLSSLIIPEGVESLEDEIISGTKIENITIPNSVIRIESWAFHNTPNLKEIYIPSKTKGQIPYEPWKNGKAIVYWKGVIKIGDYVYDTVNQKLVRYVGMSEIANIPSELEFNGIKYPVKTISSYAFANSNASYVNIPSGIEKIEHYAFRFNKKPLNINFSPNSQMKNFESEAFAETEINSIKLPDRLENIEKKAFKNSKMKSIEIPDSVKEIGEAAFINTNIKEVKIGRNSKLEKIGDGAFYFTEIETLKIPKSITKLGDDYNADIIDSPNLKKIFVYTSRQRFPFKSAQPWGGPSTTKVYYEGEFVDFSHTVDKVPGKYERNININAFIPNNSTAIIQNIVLPDGTEINLADKKWPTDMSDYIYKVNKNGNYTFKATHSSGSVMDYDVKIDDIGVPVIEARDVEIEVSKAPNYKYEDIIKLVQAKSTDEIGADLADHIHIKNWEEVNKLSKSGDFTDITVAVSHPQSGKTATKTVRITAIKDLDPIIPDPTPETDDDKPSDDYVSVLFKKGENGSLSGTQKYYVLKNGNYKIADLTKPQVTADMGWHIADPSWLDDENLALDDETIINKDLSYIAKYDKDIITIPTPSTHTNISTSGNIDSGPKISIANNNTIRSNTNIPNTGDVGFELDKAIALFISLLGLILVIFYRRRICSKA